jgi:hypothetical protein
MKMKTICISDDLQRYFKGLSSRGALQCIRRLAFVMHDQARSITANAIAFCASRSSSCFASDARIDSYADLIS